MGQAKSIAILQSNYIPWKGYFDIIASVEELLIFDEVQYTRNDWRNRNKIVVHGKPQWLTIPVAKAGTLGRSINAIEVADAGWADRHWKTIRHSYRKAPYFELVAPLLAAAYGKAASLRYLTQINELFLRTMCDVLDIPTLILRSDPFPRTALTPTDRVVELCLARGATRYVSGPAARAYLDVQRFDDVGVELRYANYEGYPTYPQQSGTFDHKVSMVDLLLCCGRAARNHLKSLRDRTSFLDPP